MSAEHMIAIDLSGVDVGRTVTHPKMGTRVRIVSISHEADMTTIAFARSDGEPSASIYISTYTVLEFPIEARA